MQATQTRTIRPATTNLRTRIRLSAFLVLASQCQTTMTNAKPAIAIQKLPPFRFSRIRSKIFSIIGAKAALLAPVQAKKLLGQAFITRLSPNRKQQLVAGLCRNGQNASTDEEAGEMSVVLVCNRCP